MSFVDKAFAMIVAGAALMAPGVAAADTVRSGRVVLMTTAGSGSGDSVCQASPFNQRACDKAEKQYDKEVRQIGKDFDKQVDKLQKQREKDLKKADSAAEKDQIRADYQEDLEKARTRRDRDLDRAQAEL